MFDIPRISEALPPFGEGLGEGVPDEAGGEGFAPLDNDLIEEPEGMQPEQLGPPAAESTLTQDLTGLQFVQTMNPLDRLTRDSEIQIQEPTRHVDDGAITPSMMEAMGPFHMPEFAVTEPVPYGPCLGSESSVADVGGPASADVAVSNDIASE